MGFLLFGPVVFSLVMMLGIWLWTIRPVGERPHVDPMEQAKARRAAEQQAADRDAAIAQDGSVDRYCASCTNPVTVTDSMSQLGRDGDCGHCAAHRQR